MAARSSQANVPTRLSECQPGQVVTVEGRGQLQLMSDLAWGWMARPMADGRRDDSGQPVCVLMHERLVGVP